MPHVAGAPDVVATGNNVDLAGDATEAGTNAGGSPYIEGHETLDVAISAAVASILDGRKVHDAEGIDNELPDDGVFQTQNNRLSVGAQNGVQYAGATDSVIERISAG